MATGPIFDVLARLLFADLPPELYRFVRVSAVPLRFNLALATELLGISEDVAAGWLREAQARALFLQPAGPAGWLGYHDLIREFLLREREAMPYWPRVVAWFEGKGDRPSAIEHALAGGLYADAARLIEPIAVSFVYETGRYQTYRRWVLSLPPQQQAAHPNLLLQLGVQLQELGRRGETDEFLGRARQLALGLETAAQADLWLKLAATYASGGRPDTAQPLIESVLAKPGLPEFLLWPWPEHLRAAIHA